ncbi:MAG: addiction module protein [Cytophagales bacterium]
MIYNVQEILKMSISECILIVEAIWDSIAENEQHVELSKETMQLLDERLEAHKNNPKDGLS